MTRSDIACLVIVIPLAIGFVFARPRHAHCPPGWWVEGVRPNGVFDCRRVPVGDTVRTPLGIIEDHSVQPPGVLDGRIFCAAGSSPRVIDARTVACEGEP